MNARSSRIRIWVAALAVVAPLVMVFHQRGAVGQQSLPASGAGQTRTLLPDGRWLVIGPGAALVDSARGTTTLVPGLAESRVWHTATLLPDGQVLVLGGQDASGRLVRRADRFNPATGTFATVTVPGWNGAAGHSATLLNDHEVLLAGGVRGDGVSDEVQRLDLMTLAVTTVAGLDAVRAYHTASLMGDGRVALWGGLNAERAEVNAGVLVDPTTGNVVEVFMPPADDPTFYVAASTPPRWRRRGWDPSGGDHSVLPSDRNQFSPGLGDARWPRG
ncbi:MAG TPA: kelch repeat-containing protein [Vicinamibacterales bacterium]|nr:kelch repeat-containing protein [Vicinamibacterales bacterium]